MSRVAPPAYPQCHPGQVARPGPHGQVPTAVWICEYPYRTIRLAGPSEDCADCPVWRNMQKIRRGTDVSRSPARLDDVERLEHQLTCRA
jgi:hypothetical protein